MIKLEGLSASRGLVMGPAFCLADGPPAEIPRYSISPSDVVLHWNRLQSALEQSRSELSLLMQDRTREQTAILEAHAMMLGDTEFFSQIQKTFEEKQINIEAALHDAVQESVKMLCTTGDSYLAERAVDIEDAFDRVMRHLLRDTANESKEKRGTGSSSRFVPPGTILIARNIKPSEAITLRDTGIVGIILEEGGATSHVAILARAWHIPAVMGVRGILDAVSDGDEVLLDGNDGLVIIAPSSDVAASYRARISYEIPSDKEADAEQVRLLKQPAKTKDGTTVVLRANIALAEEAEEAREEGASGIGLFRSEFLYLSQRRSPNEETQYAAYSRAVESMGEKPVVIRTLDVGADKMLAEQQDLAETNPLLGWRAVRYCLDRQELFKEQLRALLRASDHGDLRIMFPMISSVEELDAVLELLEEAKVECKNAGHAYNSRVKTGIMIEVPSAAVCADLLAQKCDFMSIGTNDLIQYTLAVDRENARVAHLYDGYNPAVLRLILQTIQAGRNTGTPVSMCGEMAGDPSAVFLLLGMGLQCFSMAVPNLGPVKELIRKVSLKDAVELAETAMELSAAREIRMLVEERIKNYV
ncbi:MAG TPA: phosphoenolpyruvate--protein phosphotransferase [Treponema sp.]|nr:phosphoenolpyruvate--protein phosphotransferase [Treponema sp.]